MIGSTYAHVKNFSLLYRPDLKGIRLAPAYDIISTTIYEQSTRDMAFSIGGIYSIDEIDEGILLKAAREALLVFFLKGYDHLLDYKPYII